MTVVVGLRPGYRYRVMIREIPGMPEVALYPTIEVRGSLHLQPRFSAAAFPATVDLNDLDIESALQGSMVTKVIYLEHPARAQPQATRPGEILETMVPRNADLLGEASTRG